MQAKLTLVPLHYTSQSDVQLVSAWVTCRWRVCILTDLPGETVALLLNHRAVSPNAVHPPGSGTTALHLAASLSRRDVVTLLLDQEGIDDSLRDSQGRTCLEVARGKETIRAIRGELRCATITGPLPDQLL